MSSESIRGGDKAAHRASFEETYPQYEFAELVRLTLALAGWLGGLRRRMSGRRLDVSGRAAPGEISPAE